MTARWSRAQLKLYCEKHGTVPARPRKKRPIVPRGGKTKTEADFEAWFKYRHPSLTLLYEPLRLRIDATCTYTPDFWCPELVTFYEIKGPHIWEDSVIKFKAARALHGWAKFQMWEKHLGSWRQTRKLPGEGNELC